MNRTFLPLQIFRALPLLRFTDQQLMNRVSCGKWNYADGLKVVLLLQLVRKQQLRRKTFSLRLRALVVK